jgi:hypothetical protein
MMDYNCNNIIQIGSNITLNFLIIIDDSNLIFYDIKHKKLSILS